MKKDIMQNIAGINSLTENIYWRLKNIIRNKKGYFIMLKGLI